MKNLKQIFSAKSRVHLCKNLNFKALFFAVGFSLACGVSAYAEAGDDGGIHGGDGCGGSGSVWWSTCYGGTWRYYETDSDSVSISGAGAVSGGTITGCSKYGGYYRLGLEAYNPSNNNSLGYHVGLVTVSELDSNSGVHAQVSGTDSWSDVEDAFNVALAAGATGNFNSFDDISWFCYSDSMKDDSMEEYTATYDAQSYANIGGNQYSGNPSNFSNWYFTDAETTTISFTHRIKRTDNDRDKSAKSDFKVKKNVESAGWTEIASGSTDTSSGDYATVNTDSVSVTLDPGTKQTICERIDPFDAQVKYTDNGDTRTVEATDHSSKVCVTVSRRYEGEYDGKITPSKSTSFDSTYTGTLSTLHSYVNNYVADGTPVTAYFKEELRRKSENTNALADNLGHLAPSAWSAASNRNSSNGAGPFAEDSENASFSVKTNDWQTVSTASSSTKVKVGESRQICRQLSYQSVNRFNWKGQESIAELAHNDANASTESCITYDFPYNFKNSVTSTLGDTSVAYTGETLSATFTVKNEGKYDTTSQDTYGESQISSPTPEGKFVAIEFTLPQGYGEPSAEQLSGVNWENPISLTSSITDNASGICNYFASTSKLGAVVKNSCRELQSDSGLVNANGQREMTGVTVQVPNVTDAELGTKICVAAGFDYAHSGTGSAAYGDQTKQWVVSSVSCRTIVKKPNLSVTGGHIYSSGTITTSRTSNKNINATLATAGDTKLSYGSWGEYLVVGNGAVKGISSGSALYANVLNNQNYSSLCDKSDNNLHYSPLTVANSACRNSTSVSELGDSGITKSQTFANSVIGHFLENGSARSGLSSAVDLRLLADGAEINQNIVNTDGSKRVIIIGKNLKIAANVERLDAWVFSVDPVTGTATPLDTCAGSKIGENGNLSSDTCNKSLTINGLVYASTINFNRTAGASRGQDAARAEMINLTAADYFWAHNLADSSYSYPTEVYNRELAPRK